MSVNAFVGTSDSVWHWFFTLLAGRGLFELVDGLETEMLSGVVGDA
jgi:hypothetical protein